MRTSSSSPAARPAVDPAGPGSSGHWLRTGCAWLALALAVSATTALVPVYAHAGHHALYGAAVDGPHDGDTSLAWVKMACAAVLLILSTAQSAATTARSIAVQAAAIRDWWATRRRRHHRRPARTGPIPSRPSGPADSGPAGPPAGN